MILMRHAETVFNVVFGATRRDPGVEDPPLTPRGRDQARAAAAALAGEGARRIVVSPYSRALETADILAGTLGLPVTVEPLVRERMKFVCDIGTPASVLRRRWPHFAFEALDEIWWAGEEEPQELLDARTRSFCAAMTGMPDWAETVVVTHWGVVRSLTGRRIQNCERLRVDPARPGGALVRPDDPC